MFILYFFQLVAFSILTFIDNPNRSTLYVHVYDIHLSINICTCSLFSLKSQRPYCAFN